MILPVNRKIVFGLILAGIVVVIFMFDTIFDLALELIHASFEFVEEMLDILIEHIFHTDPHNTQIIVFYLMLSIAGLVLYQLYKQLRSLPCRYLKVKENLAICWSQLKKAILAYWQDLPSTKKTKWLMGFMTSIASMVLWIFI